MAENTQGDAEFEAFWHKQGATLASAFPETFMGTKMGEFQKAILRLTFHAGIGTGLDIAQKTLKGATNV